jgi:hypothetical protein
MKRAPHGQRLLNRGCRSNNAKVLAYCYCFSESSSMRTHRTEWVDRRLAVSQAFFHGGEAFT